MLENQQGEGLIQAQGAKRSHGQEPRARATSKNETPKLNNHRIGGLESKKKDLQLCRGHVFWGGHTSNMAEEKSDPGTSTCVEKTRRQIRRV